MSRLFASGSSQYLRLTGVVLSLPMTLVTWFRPTTDAPGDEMLLSVGNAAGTDYYSLRTESVNNRLRAQVYTGVDARYSEYLTSIAGDTWYHGAAVFASDTSRIVYLGGDAASESTDDRSAVRTAISIAVSADSTPIGYFDGRTALSIIYNCALSDAEALWLATPGNWPGDLRPGNIVLFSPLLGPTSTADADFSGNRYNLTAYNSPTWADHPQWMQEMFLRKHAMGPWQQFWIEWVPSDVAGPTTYTVTAAAQAVLKMAATATAAGQAVLKEAYGKTAAGQAWVQDRVTNTAAGQAVLKMSASATAAGQAVLKEAVATTNAMQAYLVDIGADKTAAMKAILKEAYSKSAATQAWVQDRITTSAAGQAVLKEAVGAANALQAYLIDIGVGTGIAAMKSVLKEAYSKSAAAQAILKMAASATSATRAYLQDRSTLSAAIRAIIKGTMTPIAAMQAYLGGVVVTSDMEVPPRDFSPVVPARQFTMEVQDRPFDMEVEKRA